MTLMAEDAASDSYDFYSAQYARFGSQLAAEVRREAYGADLGQQSWRTLDEQADITELVKEHSPGHLLDIACGSGGPSLAIVSSTGCRLTGVDIELAGIQEAQQRAIALQLTDRAEFLIADCNQRLPFDDHAFDVVVCVDAVPHLQDRFAALVEWFRVLRPGGSLLFTDAAVLTGAVTKQEIKTRASQGDFVLVPPGLNEKAIIQAGFYLRQSKNTTPALVHIAHRLLAARQARSSALQQEEGVQWFGWRQSFLSITEELAAAGRLSRFLYVADKPT